ncbi:cell envelope integrity protein TolA [Rhodoferax sp.]|uniref:cell envelope integrity protein TolA n=1 Tax=Rhodoferax sp. TaxID=50421 RepID=UPI0025F3D987|nr:cell envelope integrity protein TolA [Rhodoferax sp.]
MHAAQDTLNLTPPQPPGMVRALGLALLAHALLLVALVINVQWKQTESATVEAELWSSSIQMAAPKAVDEPPPPPVETPRPTPPPPPVAKVQPPPPAPDVKDADIALERAKKKREAEKLEQAQQDKADKAEKAKRDKIDKDKALKAQKAEEAADKKADEDKRLKDKKAAQDKQDALDKKAQATQDAKNAAKAAAEKASAQADAKDLAAQRADNLKRMAGMAGATGGANATGSALQSSAPSSGYGGRVSAKVKPNIVSTDTFDGNPAAEVEVRSASNGTILSHKLVKSSGNKAWDDAVLKAIDKTETMPRDTDGRVPSPMILTFRPKD